MICIDLPGGHSSGVTYVPSRTSNSSTSHRMNASQRVKLGLIMNKPTYAEGRYGKGPSNGPDQVFTPYAEVEATAQVDDTNLHIRLMAPILAQDATLLT